MPYDLPEIRDKQRQSAEQVAQKRQGKGLADGRLGMGAYTPDYEEFAQSLPVDNTANTGPLQDETGAFYPVDWWTEPEV